MFISYFCVFRKSQADEPYFFQDIANINNLMHYLNASYSLKIFKSYGYLNHTSGKFDGVVGDISEQRSDISEFHDDISNFFRL